MKFEQFGSALAFAGAVGLGGLAVASCGTEAPKQTTYQAPYIEATVLNLSGSGVNVMLADGSSALLENGTKLSVACVKPNDPYGLHGEIDSGFLAGDVAVDLPRDDLQAVTNPYHDANEDPFAPTNLC